MEMQNNIIAKGKIVEEEDIDTFAGISTYVQPYMDMLFPLKVIKRVLFRPYLGRWYPYIDVYSPSYENQLSFFYGKVELEILKMKLCCGCYRELKSDAIVDIGIPVALCKECSSRVYYEYWSCLAKVVIDVFKCIENGEEDKSGFESTNCENLLKPRCNFPITFERVNPCLKNHAIGVIILTGNKLDVIVGTLETIKYQMIWRGGIFGLVFGYSNRVMNLERLSQILRVFIEQLDQIVKGYNSRIKRGANEEHEKVHIHKAELIPSFKKSENSLEVERSIINGWFLLNFLDFYTNYDAKKLIFKIIEPSFRLVEYIVESFHKKLNLKFNLELLDIIEIYKTFSPINLDLRAHFENYLNEMLRKENIKYTLKSLRRNCEDDVILEVSDNIKVINFRNMTEKLEIYEILSSMGSYILVNSNFSNRFSFIHLKDLIGCKIL